MGSRNQIIEMISVLMTSLVHNSPKKTVLESKNPPGRKKNRLIQRSPAKCPL